MSPELQERLAAKAHTLGVTESEVIRMALEDFCEPVSGQPDAVDVMLALMDEWEQEDAGKPPIDIARHARDLWEEGVWEDWQRQKQGSIRRVAEGRGEYGLSPEDVQT